MTGLTDYILAMEPDPDDGLTDDDRLAMLEQDAHLTSLTVKAPLRGIGQDGRSAAAVSPSSSRMRSALSSPTVPSPRSTS